MLSIRELRYELERRQGERNRVVSLLKTAEEEIATLGTRGIVLEKAVMVVQEVARLTQQELEFHVSDMVSHALRAVFDSPYDFRLSFVVRRDKTEADMSWEKDGKTYLPNGGGTRDLSGLALRFAFWTIGGKRSAPVFILDEPWKHLKPFSLQRRAALMLKEISKALGIQIIMVTSAETDQRLEQLAEYAGMIYNITKDTGGVSHVEKVSSRISNNPEKESTETTGEGNSKGVRSHQHAPGKGADKKNVIHRGPDRKRTKD